jgi:SAM-dependent methyltransferase
LFDSELETPANGARFFKTRKLALEAPAGKVRFDWNEEDPYLYNSAFDPSLIRYDEHYWTCASDLKGLATVPTLDYLPEILGRYFNSNPSIIDIGCGQGEFVEALRKVGVEASGYDPVAREDTSYVFKRYWQPTDPPADLYVMRCVLPHISDPWAFVQSVARSSPNGLVLIEFQRSEWVLENDLWYQISHGHVNYFSVLDFESRYDVVHQGEFSDGEWGWVLIDPSTYNLALSQKCPL